MKHKKRKALTKKEKNDLNKIITELSNDKQCSLDAILNRFNIEHSTPLTRSALSSFLQSAKFSYWVYK